MKKSEYASNEFPPVVFVPGGVMPAAMSYGSLIEVIKDQVQPVVKDLEVYATDAPPSNYGLELEVEGILHAADTAGFKIFNLVGYSAGGASSLAFTAKHPERLMSLALIEPAWIGNEGMAPEDVADVKEMDKLLALPAEARMAAFARWQMRPGFEPPKLQLPPGPPPAWMAKRPAGLDAISKAFKAYYLDLEKFRKFTKPVYYAYGDQSRLFYERNARILSRYFPDFRVEVYAGRSHFDPPHRAEPERFARALGKLWADGKM